MKIVVLKKVHLLTREVINILLTLLKCCFIYASIWLLNFKLRTAVGSRAINKKYLKTAKIYSLSKIPLTLSLNINFLSISFLYTSKNFRLIYLIDNAFALPNVWISGLTNVSTEVAPLTIG